MVFTACRKRDPGFHAVRITVAVVKFFYYAMAMTMAEVEKETLALLESQAAAEMPRPAREVLNALREFHNLYTRQEHQELAAHIEEAQRRMAHEHLHRL
jgi:hypothetical protein